MEQFILPIRITGILATIGAFIYAIGDVLLLKGKINIDDYPKLKPFQKLLSDTEKMVSTSSRKNDVGRVDRSFQHTFDPGGILAGIIKVSLAQMKHSYLSPLSYLQLHPLSEHSCMEHSFTWVNMSKH